MHISISRNNIKLCLGLQHLFLLFHQCITLLFPKLNVTLHPLNLRTMMLFHILNLYLSLLSYQLKLQFCLGLQISCANFILFFFFGRPRRIYIFFSFVSLSKRAYFHSDSLLTVPAFSKCLIQLMLEASSTLNQFQLHLMFQLNDASCIHQLLTQCYY